MLNLRMMLQKNNDPTHTKTWKNLKEHFSVMKDVRMQDLFANDSMRAEKFHLQWGVFLLDYSKNRVNQETMDLLFSLADEMQLKEAISNYFEGDVINETENRSVLHTALRAPKNAIVKVEGQNIIPEIFTIKNKIKKFTNEVLNGERKGYSEKVFTDVVNIGIGGSDLGPRMAVEALQFYKNQLNIHFVSNIDGDHVCETLKNLNPETTLFIVVSKSFATQETLTNSETIRNWFLKSGSEKDVPKHFVAISANVKKATAFGIDESNVFPMWDWIGGRFSLWSAVGLSISLSVGYDNFEKLLKGANEMDEHFKSTDFDENLPVVLALLSFWYATFFESETEAVIPYSQYLQKFSPYLQQANMESNGKNVDRNGKSVDYQTGTIIWGEPGTNSQHAFFQLIHQGTKLVPTDFIGFTTSLHGNEKHHDKLMSNFFAQTEALLNGKSENVVREELRKRGVPNENAEFLIPFKVFEGNKPTNSILIDKLTPEALGALIALYEHKIFVQGILWNIFSYDQWGVELGKELASSILGEINTNHIKSHDSSTELLLKYYLARK